MNVKSENVCLSTEELLEAKGYYTSKPTIGNLGRAIMKAANANKDCRWLQKHQDKFFSKLRRERKNGGKK